VSRAFLVRRFSPSPSVDGPRLVTAGQAVVGFLQFGTIGMTVAVVSVSLLITTLEESLLTPALMSRAPSMFQVAVSRASLLELDLGPVGDAARRPDDDGHQGHLRPRRPIAAGGGAHIGRLKVALLRHVGCIGGDRMILMPQQRHFVILLLAIVFASSARATVPDAAEQPIRQFLAQEDAQRAYRAVRRLEAENGNRQGWLEALTEYSPATGFHFQITAEGGSGYIRSKILTAILEGEREIIANRETARSSLALANYRFQANGIDSEGLANVLLSPRRKERVLVSGTMFLKPTDGDLVRLQGRLAKSPSFWIKDVDIVRTYERIDGTVVPVALETRAQIRFLGEATLRMTYLYSEIDGRPVPPAR
jgi:hypothetical protein